MTERRGWDLVTSRPLSEEQRRRCEEQARREAEERGGKAAKRPRKSGTTGTPTSNET